jgi:hypothetical protein
LIEVHAINELHTTPPRSMAPHPTFRHVDETQCDILPIIATFRNFVCILATFRLLMVTTRRHGNERIAGFDGFEADPSIRGNPDSPAPGVL